MTAQHIVGEHTNFKYRVKVQKTATGYEFYVKRPKLGFPQVLTPDLATKKRYWDVNMVTAPTIQEGYLKLQSIVNKRDKAFSREMSLDRFVESMKLSTYPDLLDDDPSSPQIPLPEHDAYYVLGSSTHAFYQVTIRLDYHRKTLSGYMRPVFAINLPPVHEVEQAHSTTVLGGHVTDPSLRGATTVHVWNDDFVYASRRMENTIQRYDKTLIESLREREFIKSVNHTL